MIKLTLFVLVCTVISTGYLQEITNNLFPPNVGNDDVISPIWPYQGYQGQRRSKPCPKRRYNNGPEEWIPSYSSRITQQRYDTPVLQPQALKNDDVAESKPDTITADDEHSTPERRSFDSLKHKDLNDDDCTEYFESNNETPVNTANVEEAVITIIKDCLKRKENTTKVPLVGSSRRSMSDPSSSDDLDEEENNNYPRVSNPADSEFFDDAINSNDNFLRDSNVDISHNVNVSDDKSDSRLTSKLMDPAIGRGIAVERSNNIIPKDARVCYACSTATNPSCWEPDIRTTIKYCPKEHSCVTKSLGVKNSLTVIRDCANSCEDSWVLGIEPKFKSCNLCHSDYCNGAISINRYNIILILVISTAKCIF